MSNGKGFKVIRNALCIAASAAVFMSLMGRDVQAASYDVHACHFPDGSAAPLDGWASSTSPHAFVYADRDCAPNGAGSVFAYLRNDVPHDGGATASWELQAPPDTALRTVQGAFELWAGPYEDFAVPHARLFAGGALLDECTRPFGNCRSRAGWLAFDVTSKRTFRMEISCTGHRTCQGTSEPKGGVRATRVVTTLDDPFNPIAQSTDGTLMEGSVRNGMDSLTLQASDRGSGVRLLRLKIGEQAPVEYGVDDNGGRCKQPYGHVVPCKLQVGARLDFDTAQVPDGKHELSIELVDAAGNATTIYGPRTHTFDNRPPVVTGRPEVVGEAQVGKALECAAPAIDGQEARVSYAWIRTAVDGSARQRLAGATGRAYTPVAADEGKKLLCEVTATDAGGSSPAVESSLTSGPFAEGGTVKPAPPAPPAEGSGAGGTGGSGGTGGNATGGAGGQAGAPGAAGAPATVTVVGAGSTGWALDAFFTRGRAVTTTAAWGSAVELGGRVRDGGGGPVADAVVEVLVRDAGGAERSLGTTRTAPDGGWALKVPARIASSRLIVRAKRAADGALRAAADLSLRVAAGVALTVSPGKVRPRGLIRFSGRLLGGPVPAKGKVLELRARSRGTKRWITFKTIRTTARGTFRTSYRLRRGFRNITYEFQVLSREEAAYPYAAGTSPVRAVRVR